MAARTSNPRTNNSVQRANSRYVQGGSTIRYQNRLGWWERRILERRDDDLTVIVQNEEDQRADIIAHNIYGNQSFDWIVLQYNNIVDPVVELTAGTELQLPNPRRLQLDIITKQTGGVSPDRS